MGCVMVAVKTVFVVGNGVSVHGSQCTLTALTGVKGLECSWMREGCLLSHDHSDYDTRDISHKPAHNNNIHIHVHFVHVNFLCTLILLRSVSQH